MNKASCGGWRAWLLLDNKLENAKSALKKWPQIYLIRHRLEKVASVTDHWLESALKKSKKSGARFYVEFFSQRGNTKE